MDLIKYSKFLSKDLSQFLKDLEKGIGIESKELPQKNLVPTGTRIILNENGLIREYYKHSNGKFYLLGGGGESGSAKEIELRKTETYIQWKLTDSEEWNNLIAISELKGGDGTDGINGIDGINGTDGEEIELRVDSGYIQWKYLSAVSWTNLIALSLLKGDTGNTGATGAAGQGINHIGFTSTTAISELPNEAGETDTYTIWGDVSETINLGTFTVYNGADGNDGSDGVDGTNGTNGSDGADGVGVPTGGTTGQVLAKKTNTNYDTEWIDTSSGGGSSDGLIYIIKNADESKSNNGTPTDDNTLKFTTEANTKYLIRIVMGYTINSSSTLKIVFNHTGTTTTFRALDFIFQDDYGSDSRYNTTNIYTNYVRSNSGNNGKLLVDSIFLDVGSSGGVFSIQWSQNYENTGSTVIRAGSYLAYKIL